MKTCIDAFKNLNIVTENNTLALSPCCYSPPTVTKNIDFTNNEYLLQVRNSWNNGIFPAACNSCQKEEVQGNRSRRIASNEWYQDNGHNNTITELIRLDYWTGDLCNLRCATCGPHNSSAWKEELKLSIKKPSINRFWQDIDLSKLRFIHFNGGEPLLSKEHVEFLKEIPKKQLVHLNYNTNGTILPSAELLSLWDQFKIVQLDFSIDDIEERFEYIRYPASWDKVSKNLKWYVDNSPVNCMFAVNTTVSILNYFNLTNLNSWLTNNFNSNRLGDIIDHRQQPALRLFALNSNKSLTEPMVKFLDDCDLRRNTNWQKTFPELSQLHINITKSE